MEYQAMSLRTRTVVAQQEQAHSVDAATSRHSTSYIVQTHNHPTVEEIYHDLLPDWPEALVFTTICHIMSFLVKGSYVNEMKFSDVSPVVMTTWAKQLQPSAHYL